MAKRVAGIYGGNPIVNMYEIADNYMENGVQDSDGV